jgi:L-histidine N-alpha-methyltransferase
MVRTSELGKDKRLKVLRLDSNQAPDFAAAVRAGLSGTPKSIPSRFFYDDIGSDLFEQITELPEYYLTRSEQSIFEERADTIVGFAKKPISLVEFGSGSSKKTRLLIEAALRQQAALSYAAVDISEDYLESTARRLLKDYPALSVTAIASEYFDSLDIIPQANCPRLFLFLGSNIGNLEDDEAQRFLARIKSSMASEDRLLVGMDLEKDASIIEPAYDDLEGITARFDKNVLARANRELGANFDLDSFVHRARYSQVRSRVEVALISQREQDVSISELDLDFHLSLGEPIHTEISRKYGLEDVQRLARGAGLTLADRWFDSQNWFGLFMFKPDL